MTLENFDAGEYILKEGERSNNKLYAILSGTVSVLK